MRKGRSLCQLLRFPPFSCACHFFAFDLLLALFSFVVPFFFAFLTSVATFAFCLFDLSSLQLPLRLGNHPPLSLLVPPPPLPVPCPSSPLPSLAFLSPPSSPLPSLAFPSFFPPASLIRLFLFKKPKWGDLKLVVNGWTNEKRKEQTNDAHAFLFIYSSSSFLFCLFYPSPSSFFASVLLFSFIHFSLFSPLFLPFPLSSSSFPSHPFASFPPPPLFPSLSSLPSPLIFFHSFSASFTIECEGGIKEMCRSKT